MRRTELERKLRALGWSTKGESSGAHHVLWRRGRSTLVVGNYDIVWDSTAERLIRYADGKER
jgi:hypothetical protein